MSVPHIILDTILIALMTVRTSCENASRMSCENASRIMRMLMSLVTLLLVDIHFKPNMIGYAYKGSNGIWCGMK